MASRRKARIIAFQALYAWDISGDISSIDDASSDGASDGIIEKESYPDFSRLLITGCIENIAVIDEMIRRHLQNWDFSRVSKVDLAILRMSVYTLMFQPDMAPSIVIDEAVSISKEFGTDDSYRFINGVLDGIRKSLITINNAEP